MMLPAFNSLNHLIPSQTTYRPLQKQQQTDQKSSQKMQRIESEKIGIQKIKQTNKKFAIASLCLEGQGIKVCL